MNRGNQQLPMNSYLKNIYSYHDVYMLESISELNTGFIRFNIVDQVNKMRISNATIRIYVTDGTNINIPIMYLITTLNPVRIELPLANELGMQIVGPLYNFSMYDLRVDAFGYFSNNIPSIRLFPGVTTDIDITMIPISTIQAQPSVE